MTTAMNGTQRAVAFLQNTLDAQEPTVQMNVPVTAEIRELAHRLGRELGPRHWTNGEVVSLALLVLEQLLQDVRTKE